MAAGRWGRSQAGTLLLQFPLAFETLRDPRITADKLYAHTYTASLCVTIATGVAGAWLRPRVRLLHLSCGLC